jgi:thiol-disulfide isomerase/thioredoxin
MRSITTQLAAIIFLFMGMWSAHADEFFDQCSLPPELVGPMLEIEPGTTDCAPSDLCATELVKTARSLADEHPDLTPLQRSYQDLARGIGGDVFEEVSDQYQLRLEQRPNDAASHYLAARIDPSDPGEVRAAHLRAVKLDPEFPWGHLGLAVSYWQWAGHAFGDETESDPLTVESDRETARQHMNEFMRLCPERFEEPLANSPIFLDTAFWRPNVQRFRSAMERAPDRLRVAHSPNLWSLEFKITPFSDHGKVRGRVTTDLESIAAMDLESFPTWWTTLEEGYRLTGDEEHLEQLMAARLETDPCSDSVARSRMQGFTTLPENPEESLAVYKEVTGWSKECPDQFPYCIAEFELSKEIELGDEERLALMDRFLACWETNRDRIRTPETARLQVARELVERDLQIERARDMILEDIGDSSTGADDPAFQDAPEEFRFMMVMTRYSGEISRDLLLARVNLELGDLDEAAAAVDTADDRLVEFELLEFELDARLQLVMVAFQGGIERLRGEIAEAGERPLDAIGHYLEAARSEDDDGDSTGDARRVWIEAGGSEATFDLVAAVPVHDEGIEIEQPSAWSDEDRELASFELTELTGEAWSSDRLRGITTVINLWATWCGPCKLELPYLQKVHEALAEREDAQVFTFNLDRNLGLIAPYIAKHGYTFPVCPASDHVQSTLGGIAIPQTWIVDSDGVIRFTQGGFSPDRGDEWVAEVLEKVDLLSGG